MIVDPWLIRNDLLHELFETSADRRPASIAVECGSNKITYAALEARANQVAHALRARGIGPDDRVAILLPRGLDPFVALLGVLKAGAAYVPIDASTPDERSRFIIDDCGAKTVLTTATAAAALRLGARALRLDADAAVIDACPVTRVPRQDIATTPQSLCYVIYTSGTTGQPKGVLIEHHSATHLVRAESALYGIRETDRVCQVASLAFDVSVEEIWAAFAHGATLVAATDELAHAGPDFSRAAVDLDITVLSCVPTFLSMISDDIPTLRILILGGETLPTALIARWLRPGRAVFNTYGPTEATVIATARQLEPDRPVTIGTPIANYDVLLLGDDGQPVAAGSEGEIAIGGEGVARGYLNRPDLDREKFITMTIDGRPRRLYRTGDLGRWNSDGELEYRGRNDGQVKIRGFRVELGEIEAVLSKCAGVRAAAAAVHAPSQRIAAFVVALPAERLDRDEIRRHLSANLPPHMVPAFLDELDSLPMTTSGKIDRVRLPAPVAPLTTASRTVVAPRNDAERAIIDAFHSVFGRSDISVDDDFFYDLNGHSLLAAHAVSSLRRAPGFAGLSIADLYAKPTAAALAELCETHRSAGAASTRPAQDAFHETPTATYFACAAGQALAILFLSGLAAWQWLGAFFAYGYLVLEDYPVREALVYALIVQLVTAPMVLVFSIVVKWLLLGRMRPGRYPLWGWYYWRFWFVRAVGRTSPVHYLDGTPLLNIYYRLMGARIGRDVVISRHGVSTYDLLSVGDGTNIGLDATLDGATIENGMLKLAPVVIGRNCWIGNRSSMGSDTALGDCAGLADLSCLGEGARVPPGELWKGSPARSAGRLEPDAERRRPWSFAAGVAYLVGAGVFPLVILSSILPGLMVITHIGHNADSYAFLIAAPVVALSFILVLCLELYIVKWLLIGRLREGRYPVGGFFYFRKWFFDQLMTLSFEVTETLYETLYVAPWLRALGARIGPRCEVEAIDLVQPDLLHMGSECFIADLVLVGAPHLRSGWLTIGSTRMGNRVFVGNSAVLPAQADLGNNVLIGILSLPPDGAVHEGGNWFGSPPFSLPVRYISDKFSEQQTYRPPRRIVAQRLFIEFFRVILPSTIFVVLASLIMIATDTLQDYIGLREWLLTLPFLYLGAGILGILVTVAIKLILIGRYRSGEKPFWCHFVWRNDIVTGVYQNLCDLFFLGLLRGTPFMAWALRLFGMKIGRRCYIDTTWFTEFDLVEIGDEAALNENANLQTHLFEDRVIKMGTVRIGRRCTVGAMATVLYDTKMDDGSTLGDLSLMMKGETLPAGSRWHGIPARPA